MAKLIKKPYMGRDRCLGIGILSILAFGPLPVASQFPIKIPKIKVEKPKAEQPRTDDRLVSDRQPSTETIRDRLFDNQGQRMVRHRPCT